MSHLKCNSNTVQYTYEQSQLVLTEWRSIVHVKGGKELLLSVLLSTEISVTLMISF